MEPCILTILNIKFSIYSCPCFVEIIYLYPVDNKKKLSRAIATSHIKFLECTAKTVVNTDQQRLYLHMTLEAKVWDI